ncbi:MAG TPA: MMPL family transporter [Solirubrobacteraceae bacterium]
MNRLSAFVRHRRKLVAIVWLVLLLVSVPFASRQTENLTGGGFEAPGTGSAEVDQQVKRFQNVSSESLGVVLQRKDGNPADVVAAVDRVDQAAAKVDNIELTDAAAAKAKSDAAGNAVVLLPLAVSGSRDDALQAAKDLRDEVGVGKVKDGVQPYVVGQQGLWAGMQELQKSDLEKAETTGFPAILIVLIAVFGSALAALLPAGLGVAAVILTGAAVYFLALATTMSVFVTNVASMLGIGVAVDYSLFLLSRYREELEKGAHRDEALDIAMRTSGATVVFSGMTVVVSLAGLFLLDSTVMRSMAIGAIVVVAIAIIGAVTLLPALIALLGRRADERGRVVSATGALIRRVTRRKTAAERGVPPGAFWKRWSDRVMARPALSAILASGFLLVLAIPALSLNFGNGALAQFPKDYETRVGAELASQKIPPGASAPTIVIADFHKGSVSDPANRAALDRYVQGLKDNARIAAVASPVASTDGQAALINVVLRQDPESKDSLHFVGVLRDEGGSASGLAKVAAVNIGGSTAQTRDFTHLIQGGLWKVFAFVMVCSYLVLLVVLRSVLLPLKAVLMNVLSVAAAWGVLVAVFQYGWLDGITGYNSLGYINAVTPPLLLAIVFGLSMDYEVFLLSRIRERYLATGDNRRAVSEGLQSSAKVISSAAIIMVVVFGVFATTGVPQIKEIGLGLAVAIGLDATVVRLVLVPATMQLMGNWNWWMPEWLGRILPEADFESDHAVEEDERTPAVV